MMTYSYYWTPPNGMPFWLPIDTAPRDGRAVMLYTLPKGRAKTTRTLCRLGYWNGNGWHIQTRGYAHAQDNSFTHWGPLPPQPPAAEPGAR